MTSAYLIIKILHIVAGCLALITGLAAILLRRNTRKHKPAGRIYFWCMSFIFASSLFMALYKFNLFLFFINIFTYHSALTAYRSLKLKQLHNGQKPPRLDWTIEGLNALANAGLLLFGLNYAFRHSVEGGAIAMVFGSLGLRNSWVSLRRLRGFIKDKNYWLLAHIGGMLGSYIGAITAFMVNNNRWMGLPESVAWLSPALVLIPFLSVELARHRHKTENKS